MNFEKYGLDSRKAYFIVLILGMASMVTTFNMGYELVAAGITITAVTLLYLIGEKSERPVFDERDLSIAKESTHQAVMWTGVFGGLAMIVISIGMGLNYWSYPEWAAPYYLSWGVIIGLAVLIDIGKRLRGVK
ncbi:MAG: putative membrane protein [Candidatus Nanohaloarchaea archaeon]|jgi:uncharacterized membrane protein